MSDGDRLRRDSLRLSRIMLVLVACTALLILLPTFISLAARGASGDARQALLRWCVVIGFPSVFYLYALWAFRAIFRGFAVNGVFGSSLSRGCSRAGVALALGATVSAVVAPNLLRLLGSDVGDGYLGAGPTLLRFDLAYLAVGAVGLALVLLGRLLARAAEAQQENARLRDELDGFL